MVLIEAIVSEQHWMFLSLGTLNTCVAARSYLPLLNHPMLLYNEDLYFTICLFFYIFVICLYFAYVPFCSPEGLARQSQCNSELRGAVPQ